MAVWTAYRHGMARVCVLGAGVTGIWQAYELAKSGHFVTLTDTQRFRFQDGASAIAGAMLAPYCETEAADPLIAALGERSISLWQEAYSGTIKNGSLVVARPRDRAELRRFASVTHNFQNITPAQLQQLEPDLTPFYEAALFYPGEAHLEPALALPALLQRAIESGCQVCHQPDVIDSAAKSADWIIDCRGMGAAAELPDLRGVRGEMLVVETSDISLQRPIRLLHPRQPLYVVPWSTNRFMAGASVIESADSSPPSVRSVLDLLSSLYTLHPAFAEARIIKIAASVRPAFPDNLPRITIRDRHIHVNGLYRHGFLLAPVLAGMTRDFLAYGTVHPRLFAVE